MTALVVLQLVSSFIAGGFVITLLSIIAEKTNDHIAGIIMMFPTTIVLGFFFLGLTTTAENVSLIVPSTLIPLGIVIFSSVIYIHCSIYFSKHIKNKSLQITSSFLVSVFIWFIIASPFAVFKFSNLVVGVIGFFIIISITHFILNNREFQSALSRPNYTKKQILYRAIFTGTIIALVVLFGKILNPFWGGLFTMFPAATLATLVLLHYYYEPKQLFYFMRNAPIGSISLFLYAISVMVLYPKLGIWIGTIISYCISLIVTVGLIKYKLSRNKM